MPKQTFPRTKGPHVGRSILYIELKSPYPGLLKELAERENRSAKAQAEVIVMQYLDALGKAPSAKSGAASD